MTIYMVTPFLFCLETGGCQLHLTDVTLSDGFCYQDQPFKRVNSCVATSSLS